MRMIINNIYMYTSGSGFHEITYGSALLLSLRRRVIIISGCCAAGEMRKKKNEIKNIYTTIIIYVRDNSKLLNYYAS